MYLLLTFVVPVYLLLLLLKKTLAFLVRVFDYFPYIDFKIIWPPIRVVCTKLYIFVVITPMCLRNSCYANCI